MGWREEQQSCDGFCEITSLKIRVRAARPKATSKDIQCYVALWQAEGCFCHYRITNGHLTYWNDFPWTKRPLYFPSPGWCVHDRCVPTLDLDLDRRRIVTRATHKIFGSPAMPVDHQAARDTSEGHIAQGTHRPRKKSLGTPLHRVEKPNSWTSNFIEVSWNNLESSQTWGFCMVS
jgi:hypothetical protein